MFHMLNKGDVITTFTFHSEGFSILATVLTAYWQCSDGASSLSNNSYMAVHNWFSNHFNLSLFPHTSVGSLAS